MWPDYPFISPPAARSSPPPPAPLSSAAPPDGAVDMYYVQQLQSFGKACGMDMSSRIPGRSLFRKSRIETNDTINSPRFDRKPEKAAVLHVAAATRAIGGWPHRPAQKPCALLHPPPPSCCPPAECLVGHRCAAVSASVVSQAPQLRQIPRWHWWHGTVWRGGWRVLFWA